MSRYFVALALAAAIGTSPLILDLCAGSCEAAHQATRLGTAPACHHTPSPATKLETLPLGCGHDHHGTTMTAARDSGVAVQTFFVAVLESPGRAFAPSAPLQVFVGQAISPPPNPFGHGFSSTLRI